MICVTQHTDLEPLATMGVDRNRTPLTVAHGADDARVKLAESDRFVEILRTQERPVEYTVTRDGHTVANRSAWSLASRAAQYVVHLL
ncbi:predicted protein [Streptomyces iranensis]|uniref:Peptidase S9 prolyl oligopeptidase catalytic domain-containing protein n=1 Tax=Streptomyces iranensis TaxID=576784 RepID=A0A060ZM67_9ACTN|nr:predicted protein [Streptomyces iranensis]